MGQLFLYDSRFSDGAPAASSTAAGYDVANLTDLRSFTFWKANGMPATVTSDCGSAKAADYAIVWGHNLGTLGLTVEVRASTDNFSASDVLVASNTPSDDKPILVTFASASYRYWRLKFTGPASPTIAIAFPGAALDVPAGVMSGFDPIGRKVVEQYNRSIDGHALGKVINFEQWQQSPTFELLSWSWLRSYWVPAWAAHLRSEPFLFAWDSTNYPKEVFHCVADGQFSAPHRPGALCNLTVPLRGLALEA